MYLEHLSAYYLALASELMLESMLGNMTACEKYTVGATLGIFVAANEGSVGCEVVGAGTQEQFPLNENISS